MLTDNNRANLIDRAKNTLKPLTAEALKKDPGLAFQPDSINAFVTIRTFAPAEWARWKTTLKLAGVSLRDLGRQMGGARAKLKVVERGTSGPRTVSTMLGAGCPA